MCNFFIIIFLRGDRLSQIWCEGRRLTMALKWIFCWHYLSIQAVSFDTTGTTMLRLGLTVRAWSASNLLTAAGTGIGLVSS